MTDIAAVLDAAATAVAGAGKPDVKALGQAGKHAASFFAVLAARMGGQDTAALPAGDDVEALVSTKSGGALLSTDADMGALPSPIVAGASATLALPFHQSLPEGVAVVPDGVGTPANPQGMALPFVAPVNTGAVSMSDDGGAAASAGPSEGASGGRAVDVRAGSSGLRDVDGETRTANSAAGSASRGQLLPPAMLARACGEQAGVPPAEFMKDGMGEGAASEAANSAANPLAMAAANITGNAATDIPVARPFEQVMRQAENRLHVSVDAPVRSHAFASELGEKIVWLSGRQGQIAELSLNPPQLGSVEVRLSLSGGEAGAQFFSASPAVREAIEVALPRLRELMAQAGINLGEAQVRDEAFMQGRSSGDPDRERPAGVPGEAGILGEPSAGVARARGMGLVDLYV